MTRVPSSQYPIVAREGYPVIAVTAALGIAGYLVNGGAIAIAISGLLVMQCYFFRDPHRESPSLPLALVAPIDGRVTHVAVATDPWLGREATCVSVVMSLFDVHTVFAPTEGKIIEQWSEARFAHAASRSENRAVAYLIRTDEGDDVVMEIARSRFGGPLRFHYQPGERVGHGRRVAYAALGCRVTLYAASGTRLDCDPGNRVSAAASVVATLVHDGVVSAIHADHG